MDRGLMGEFGQDVEVTPLLFSKDMLGFLMTTESQDLGLTVSSKGRKWSENLQIKWKSGNLQINRCIA